MNVVFSTLYCMTTEAVYVRMWQEEDRAFWTIIAGKKTIVAIISVTMRKRDQVTVQQ